ncbi:transposase [Plantactinospora sp. GCM10030261]|uniref:transposase n=1 Tax=Plantactinospora sp. GCM10030261 TaxID=3273420 RepID=UPI0036225619
MSGEEDDHVALVRVYCGLALADQTARPASAGPALTSAVVDDAGRLLHVCDVGDDAAGYARLSALLAERSSGPGDAAVAADSDDHLVVSLLSAAGRPLAIADDDSVDDYAERFADDDSVEEMQAPPAVRRAVGLARALQAGALWAATLPAPRELTDYKPMLAAHAALATGRHSAAAALREVLRELYPAALRAYPDPAEPVSLAVLDALPEPGMLGGGPRARAASTATEQIIVGLAAHGIAAPAAIDEAVTALRVAIAETGRRASANTAVTAAAAETVRQAVAAVRACDAGCEALVTALSARMAPPALPNRGARRAAEAAGARRPAESPAPRRAAPESAAPRRAGAEPAQSDSGRTRRRAAEEEPMPVIGRRRQPEPAGTAAPHQPEPVAPPPIAPAPVGRPAAPPRPVAPAARTASDPRSASREVAESAPAAYRREAPASRPVSAPPPPPPGITPINPGQRGPRPPAEAGEPFRPTLTTAAINSARAERQRATSLPPSARPERPAPPSNGFSATDLSLPVPAPRPEPPAPPGSRANWPLVNGSDEHADAQPHGGRPANTPSTTGEQRVTPPWLADDLPPEPPVLRLVEPPPLADRALRDDFGRRAEPADDTPPLRLVGTESDLPTRGDLTNGARFGGAELPARRERTNGSRGASPEPAAALDSSNGHRNGPADLPVSDEGDGDLLIFAATRSAWFTGHTDEPSELDWSSTADTGWHAAEQAARPSIGTETGAGLPKRVPQANLVPGSPLRDERPLRIVRNAASLAENTTGYFRGWRRGQEIGGYAVGGRPGRESAGGWDFSREQDDSQRDYEFRSAGYRS